MASEGYLSDVDPSSFAIWRCDIIIYFFPVIPLTQIMGWSVLLVNYSYTCTCTKWPLKVFQHGGNNWGIIWYYFLIFPPLNRYMQVLQDVYIETCIWNKEVAWCRLCAMPLLEWTHHWWQVFVLGSSDFGVSTVSKSCFRVNKQMTSMKGWMDTWKAGWILWKFCSL